MLNTTMMNINTNMRTLRSPKKIKLITQMAEKMNTTLITTFQTGVNKLIEK